MPSVRKVELPTTMPALVAAYNLYGTATRADEIVTRNHVRHLGVCQGRRS